MTNSSSGINYNEGTLIQNTLYAIEKQMTKNRLNERVPPLPSWLSEFTISYRAGLCFTDVPEAPVDYLLAALEMCRQACLKAVDRPANQAEFAVMNDTHGLLREARPNSKIAASNKAPTDFDAFQAGAVPRRVTQWQSAAIYYHVNFIVHAFLETVDQFVPRDYAHPLLHRCWGALKAIVEVCFSTAYE
jgi:hypothetical protein